MTTKLKLTPDEVIDFELPNSDKILRIRYNLISCKSENDMERISITMHKKKLTYNDMSLELNKNILADTWFLDYFESG